MAFTVTPTSGAVPYLFEAVFSNKASIIAGNYSVHFYSSVNTVGSCPSPPVAGTDQQNVVNSLLNTGSYTLASNGVPEGNCRVFNLVIREVSSGNIVDSSSVSIDNV